MRKERMAGFLWIAVLLLSVRPAFSTIYTWQDDNGVQNFTDDPGATPKDARVTVWSRDPANPGVSMASSMETPVPEVAADEAANLSRGSATQGDFVLQLVQELGIAKPTGAQEAADLLTSIRVSPTLGEWDLGGPMTPELTVRLRSLTVSAAQMGRITLTPEQALIAFDSAAALLGVDIPFASNPAYSEASGAYLSAPPMVYLSPPPADLYPYYTWVPVGGGYWSFGVWFGGFFLLHDFGHFGEFHHHRFGFDFDDLRGHFVNQVAHHRFVPNGPLGRPTTIRGRRLSTGVRATPFRTTRAALPSSRLAPPPRVAAIRSTGLTSGVHRLSPESHAPSVGSPSRSFRSSGMSSGRSGHGHGR